MRAVGCKRLRGRGMFRGCWRNGRGWLSTAKKTRLLYFTSSSSFSIFLYNSHRGKEGLLMLTIFRGAAVLFLLTAQVAIGQTGSERQRHARRQDAKTGSSPWGAPGGTAPGKESPAGFEARPSRFAASAER